MKIDILRIIEEALIGGRNGEMAYIENNPFIVRLYSEWCNKTKRYSDFKGFLTECLNTNQEDLGTQTITTYKPIKKRYDLSSYDENYKEYKQIQSQISVLQRDMQNTLKEIAESKNKALADISTYEVMYGEYGSYIEFKVLVEEITEMTEVKEKE